ncbi:MAG: cysteine hydrolase [Thermotogae bacterium]|nr:cysteine hydrolase [Thermotogota bacterium]
MKALMVIDLQNDFAKPGGALYFEGAEGVIPHILRRVQEYKKRDLPVITTQDWHNADDAEFDLFPPHCVAGTSGAELVSELLSELQDYQHHYVIKKKRYSAFYNTNLDEVLERLEVNEVELCGLVTNICVLHTAEELRNRDMVVVLDERGVKSYDSSEHEWALRHMEKILGVQVIRIEKT